MQVAVELGQVQVEEKEEEEKNFEEEEDYNNYTHRILQAALESS